MNSSLSLKKPLSNVSRWFTAAFGLVALAGFADATYLTIEHYMNRIPPCAAGSCELVLTSKYATLIGIPDSLVGSIYYLALVVLVVLYFDTKKEVFLRIGLFATIAGLLASAGFVYLMAFVIHAYCQYCLGSAATSTILFILAVFGLIKYRRDVLV